MPYIGCPPPPPTSTRSPRLTTPYSPEEDPLVGVVLKTADRGSAAVLGVVDSGAQRTLLPKAIAKSRLGLTDTALIEDSTSGMGVERREDDEGFPTWSSAVSITGQVVSVAPDGKPEPWGPEFPLNPAFAETDAILLGRTDFFQAFAVSFEPGVAGEAKFVLEY
jgi:hypothetical protein